MEGIRKELMEKRRTWIETANVMSKTDKKEWNTPSRNRRNEFIIKEKNGTMNGDVEKFLRENKDIGAVKGMNMRPRGTIFKETVSEEQKKEIMERVRRREELIVRETCREVRLKFRLTGV